MLAKSFHTVTGFLASCAVANPQSASDSQYVLQIRKTGEPLALGKSLQRFGSTSVAPLTTAGRGNYFFASLTVGDSPDPQQVVFDTGSSDTYFIGSTCTSDVHADCAPNEPGAIVVDASSFVATGAHAQTVFGNGNNGANYTIYNTTVRWGSMVSTNLPVGIATYLFGGVGTHGVVGMAFNHLSRISASLGGANANFLDHAGLSSFGVYVDPVDASVGEVSFGFYDTSKFHANETFQWFPVVNPDTTGYWAVTLPGVIISWVDSRGNKLFFDYESEETATTSGTCVVDTGTPEIVLTEDARNKINRWFNPRYDPVLNEIPCTTQSSGNPLTFTLTSSDGTIVSYNVPYDTLVMAEPSGACRSLISGDADQLGLTILGAPFYQTAFVAHDKKGKRVGFVQLSQSAATASKKSQSGFAPVIGSEVNLGWPRKSHFRKVSKNQKKLNHFKSHQKLPR